MLDLALDIAGSLTRASGLDLNDEKDGLGSQVQAGASASASVNAVSSGLATIIGLSSMTDNSVGRFLTLSGASNSGNNGTFLIVEKLSATSVKISNPNAAAGPGGASLSWVERNSYSAQDDFNYARSDRQNIKGTSNFWDDVPSYTTPRGNTVIANLQNLAGKGIDSKGFILPKIKRGVSMANSNDGYVTIEHTGAMQHSTDADRKGIPCFDGDNDFAGSYAACYVEIVDAETENEFVTADGYKIFGITRAGNAVSPDQVEVVLKKVQFGQDLSSSVSYNWDLGSKSVNMSFGFYDVIEDIEEDAFRRVEVLGLASDGDLRRDVNDLQAAVGLADNTDHLVLTHSQEANYSFKDLSATPTVVDALEALNESVGDRTYTGQYLTSGETIVDSLIALRDEIINAQVVRYTMTVSAGGVAAFTNVTVPAASGYTMDGGNGMWVFTRGLLRSPGLISEGGDYQEVDTNTIKFYTNLYEGDHINFFVRNHA